MNIFATTTVYASKEAFIVYSFNRRDASKKGTQKSYQRFEQCIYFLETNMRLALEALMAETYFDSSTQTAAKEFAKEAARDVLEKFKANTNAKNDKNIKKKLVEKIKSMKFFIMFPDELLNQTMVGEVYEELELDGSESLVEMFMALKKQKVKLLAEKSTNWMRLLNRIMSEFHIKHFIEENVLNVPVMWTLYPFYFQNRSRFFNTVTLYKDVAQAVNKGLLDLFKKVFKIV